MAILLFVFFLIVFILMLVGGRILKKIKDTKKAVEEAADRKEQRYRNETGRQRQQYSQRPQPQQQRADTTEGADDAQDASAAQGASATPRSERVRPSQNEEQETARRTQTATGETIIDHHHETRENKKIFDDSDGEYVDFTEES